MYLFSQNAHEMNKAKTMKNTPCDRVDIFLDNCDAIVQGCPGMTFSLVKCASLWSILIT